MSGESGENRGDMSKWTFDEPEPEVKILDPEKAEVEILDPERAEVEILDPEKIESPIKKVVDAVKRERAEQNEAYQGRAAERKERIESLSPAKFVEGEIENWRKKHEKSEYVDINSPYEALQCLLALLIEEGSSWPPQKAQAFRRITIDFMKKAFKSMTQDQQRLLQVIYSNPDFLETFEDVVAQGDEENAQVNRLLRQITGQKQGKKMLSLE